MKLKVEHIFEAMVTLSQIIRDERHLPLKGNYHLARLHAKLLPDFQVISTKRDEIIKSFDVHQKIPDPTFVWDRTQDPMQQNIPMIDGPGYIITPELQEAFIAQWKPLGEEEIEIDLQPIPLASLDLGQTTIGGITARELSILGELVRDA